MRLDPQQTLFYMQKNKELVATEKLMPRIVLFGDSRIAMWGNHLKIEGYQVINRGIGGETSAQSLLRVENDILLLDADMVVIQIGINDLKTIAFLGDRTDQIVRALKQNITALVDKLTKKGVKVYLMTIIPASEPTSLWRLFWLDEIDQKVGLINKYIGGLKGVGLFVIDGIPVFNNDDKLKSDYTLDTLHMNNRGYSALTGLIKKTLQQHLNSSRNR